VRRFLLGAVLVVALSVGALLARPSFMSASHLIEQDTLFGGGHCTATAVGPHALLTASHCEEPSEEIYVDGEEATIVEIIRDSHDHSILLLQGIEFPAVADVSDAGPSDIGDEVEMSGNPARFVDIYRHGYVAGIEETFVNAPSKYLYDLHGFFGDSGAAVFHKGKIVGVISFLVVEESHEERFSLMGGFSLAFTKQQLARARVF